jgi:hypothetical protein
MQRVPTRILAACAVSLFAATLVSANPIDNAVKTLGIDKAYKPTVGPITVSITPAMKEKPNPGDKTTFYKSTVTKKFGKNSCVAVAVAAPKGTQLFAYIGAASRGDYADKASDGGSGEPIGIQFCTVLNQDIMLMFMTDKPGDVQYSVFTKTPAYTPAQVKKAIDDCTAECSARRSVCLDFHGRTRDERAVCEEQRRSCASACAGD